MAIETGFRCIPTILGSEGGGGGGDYWGVLVWHHDQGGGHLLLESECLLKEQYLQKLKIKIKLVGVILWENKKWKGAHSNNIAHLQLIAVYPKQMLEKKGPANSILFGG